MSDLPAGFRIVQPGQQVQPQAVPALPSGFRIVQPQAAPEPSFTEKLGQTWPAQIAKSIYGAVTLPGDVMAGRVNPTSDEGIGRAFDLAGVASPLSAGSRGVAAAMPRTPSPGQQTAEAATRLGVQLPRAVVSDKTAVQQLGKIAANVPIGGTPLRQASERAIGQLDDAARRTQDGFGSGNVAKAGTETRSDIDSYIRQTLRGRVDDAYKQVDTVMDETVLRPLSATASVAQKISGERQNAAIRGNSPALREVQDALARPEGLNYEGVKNLRTRIGEFIDGESPLPAGASEAEYKRIYAGLTDDLRSLAREAGGTQGATAFERANSLNQRVSEERRELSRILKTQNDEGIFSRVEAMATTSSRANQSMLLRTRGAVSPETWDEIGSAVIARMGRAPDGSFSPDRFVTAYGKLSDEGKRILFNTQGKEGLATALDDIATVSSRFKQLNQFANPSGTGQTIMGGAMGTGAILDPMTTISTIGGARVLSSILAKPASARAMANWAKAYERSVTQPTQAAQQVLSQRSRSLSLVIANDMGAPQAVNQIAQALSGGAVKLAAEDNGQNGVEGQGVPQNAPAQQPRRLRPGEL